MFMRFVQLKVNPVHMETIRPFYDKIVIPELQEMPGCLFAGLIQSSVHPHEYISMTLWNTKQNAEAYEKSGTYQKLFNQIKPLLAESTEWKIQLSENLELQYMPVPEETLLKQYTVTVQTEEKNTVPEDNPRMYVRIVSPRLQKGKLEEFRKIYSEEIVPVLRATKGCHYAYLVEGIQDKNDVISVTIWDSQEDAEMYEKSGRFAELTEKVKHTFSQLYQWKMALEKEVRGRVKTSEELKVSHYNLVTGKSFH